MDASTQRTELTGSFTAAAWDRIAPIMVEIEALLDEQFVPRRKVDAAPTSSPTAAAPATPTAP